MAFKYGAVGPQATKEDKQNAFRRGVIANANRGGENVATGALIGALLGAECGFSNLPKDLVEGLARSQHAQLEQEIDKFVRSVPFGKSLRNNDGSL